MAKVGEAGILSDDLEEVTCPGCLDLARRLAEGEPTPEFPGSIPRRKSRKKRNTADWPDLLAVVEAVDGAAVVLAWNATFDERLLRQDSPNEYGRFRVEYACHEELRDAEHTGRCPRPGAADGRPVGVCAAG